LGAGGRVNRRTVHGPATEERQRRGPTIERQSESPDPFRNDRERSCRIALRLDDAYRASRRARSTVAHFYSGRLAPQRLADLLLLVSELVTNAMEHGARGLVTLDVTLGDEHITVTVTSPGEVQMVGSPSSWRLPASDRRTGRGLALTARLADAVSVFGGDGYAGTSGWIAISAELTR
jgi:anti-sigma regulatory factor (Ser/Thr protein kinase)